MWQEWGQIDAGLFVFAGMVNGEWVPITHGHNGYRKRKPLVAFEPAAAVDYGMASVSSLSASSLTLSPFSPNSGTTAPTWSQYYVCSSEMPSPTDLLP